jgi:GNAT superfamily N-acetyltransferase
MDVRLEFVVTASANLIAMGMVVRRATAEDSGAIARIQVDTWRTTYRGIVPHKYLDEMEVVPRAEYWRGHLAAEASRVYVAETNGKIYGFISGCRLREPFLDFDGEIAAIYIVFEAQRRGCGRALMERLSQDLLRDGLESAVVWVLERNPSCGFYARLGGELVGRKSITIGGADLIEVAYGWKDLRLLAEDA